MLAILCMPAPAVPPAKMNHTWLAVKIPSLSTSLLYEAQLKARHKIVNPENKILANPVLEGMLDWVLFLWKH